MGGAVHLYVTDYLGILVLHNREDTVVRGVWIRNHGLSALFPYPN